MPSLELVTNVKVRDPKAFAVEFSKFSADVLGKPEEYITVQTHYNETLTFAGTFDPAFTLTIISLGNINPDANERYSKQFFDFFHKHLKVPDHRGYVTFLDPGNAFLGHKSTTFSTIFGTK